MFHFCEFGLDIDTQTQCRFDICSGLFKHIPPYIIDEVACIVLSDENKVLLVQNSVDQSWILPGKNVDENQSPKEVILKKFLELKIEIKLKNLEQFCYQKTCEIAGDELDKSGNPLWEVKSVQVIFLAKVNTAEISVSEGSKWIEITELADCLKSIYGQEKTVNLVQELLEQKTNPNFYDYKRLR